MPRVPHKLAIRVSEMFEGMWACSGAGAIGCGGVNSRVILLKIHIVMWHPVKNSKLSVLFFLNFQSAYGGVCMQWCRCHRLRGIVFCVILLQ